MDRRTLRTRKVSQRMAVVDESERKQAMAARLEALENDVAVQDTFAAGSDDEEFVLREDSEGEEEETIGSKAKKRKKSRVDGGMRKTRGMISGTSRGPKGFKDWLEESGLDRLPDGEPSYLTAAAGPPKTRSARKLCSVCEVMASDSPPASFSVGTQVYCIALQCQDISGKSKAAVVVKATARNIFTL